MNALPKNLPTCRSAKKYKNPHDVAKRLNPQQPVHCFSANALAQRISLFKENFPGDIAYAVKANPAPMVIKTAALAGLDTFDVASPVEMELIAQHAPGAKIHYHNPVRSRYEIELAWHTYHCRRYCVDDIAQLRKIRDIVENPGEVEIAVRFRLPSSGHSVHDFSQKFGLAPKETSHLLAQVKLCGFIPVLTFHPGSQCLDPASWRQHIIIAAQIARIAGVKIAKLNVGGGFPVDYASHNAPDLKLFFDQIKKTTRQSFGADTAPLLECEPGRALVAPAISLLTRVKMVRSATKEVFLNDGIYGNLMESSQAPKLQPGAHLVQTHGTPTHGTPTHGTQTGPTGPTAPFIIYGPTCDPMDRLPGTVALPRNIAEDDFVVFRNNGAYGTATSTNFNGYGSSRILQVEAL